MLILYDSISLMVFDKKNSNFSSNSLILELIDNSTMF